MKWKKSLRLGFGYQNNNIVLVSQTRVGIIPPPSEPVEEAGDYTGYFLTLSDRDRGVFYVQRLVNPFRTEAESYGEGVSGIHPLTKA